MPARRKPRNSGVIMVRAPMHGQGIFSKLLGKKSFIKKNKLISRGAMGLGQSGRAGKFTPLAYGVGFGADLLGFGKKLRRKAKRKAPVKRKRRVRKK